jgi:hypothetical protein
MKLIALIFLHLVSILINGTCASPNVVLILTDDLDLVLNGLVSGFLGFFLVLLIFFLFVLGTIAEDSEIGGR